MENTNEFQTGESGGFSFDPIVLLVDLAKRWLIILLAAVTVGVGAYIVKDATYTPVYRTTITFVVTDRSSASTVFTNLSNTNTVAAVISELMNSSILRKEILTHLDGASFDGSINASVISGTNLITVNVTATDSRTAFLVARAIIDYHETVTYQVVDGISLEVLQNPSVPGAPINRANAGEAMKKAALLAAAAAAALLAFQFSLRDSICSAAEARRKLDCTYLGELPHEKKHKTLKAFLHQQKTGILITDPLTGFRYVENIRKLRHRVEQRMQGGKVLMVTSLHENEGKSTVAVNLALAMAQKKSKVLLMDCDLRKPACYLLLNQQVIHKGLRDVLMGKANIASAMIGNDSDNLHMLLEKRSFSNTGELLASENMRSLLSWARKTYDMVILDLPPLAAAADAVSMTDYADACLLVIRQNHAPTAALNKGIATLTGGKAKLLGCVLNNVYTTSLTSGQGHVYGYYSRYGKNGKYGKYGAYGSTK